MRDHVHIEDVKVNSNAEYGSDHMYQQKFYICHIKLENHMWYIIAIYNTGTWRNTKQFEPV